MSEKQISQNVTPQAFEGYTPNLVPHPLVLAGRGLHIVAHAVKSFITERHTIPYAEHAPRTGADEMLLGEQDGTRTN